MYLKSAKECQIACTFLSGKLVQTRLEYVLMAKYLDVDVWSLFVNSVCSTPQGKLQLSLSVSTGIMAKTLATK